MLRQLIDKLFRPFLKGRHAKLVLTLKFVIYHATFQVQYPIENVCARLL